MALISYLNTVDFDHGAVSRLGEALDAAGIERPLLVTDAGLTAAGLIDRVCRYLPAVPIFDATPANPTEEAVAAAVEAYRAEGCDGLVAVGGGSPMDLAKAAALAVSHPGPIAQYAAVAGGAARITSRAAPVVAVPTTAGTGSEVGRAALIAMTDGRKLGFISPHLLPKRAVCDPDLTIGLPAGLTAATGMDAVAHCIETFLSPTVNPPADAIALDGLARALRHIERAVDDGGDREARWQMMMASLEGGLAFQKGLGAVHAMSHPLGGLRRPVLHHGTLNAVLLPPVLRFNAPACGSRYEALRAAMGLSPAEEPADAIAALNARLGMPPGLSAMGVPAEVLPRMAEAAVADHCTRTNPRPASAEDYARLYAEAYG